MKGGREEGRQGCRKEGEKKILSFCAYNPNIASKICFSTKKNPKNPKQTNKQTKRGKKKPMDHSHDLLWIGSLSIMICQKALLIPVAFCWMVSTCSSSGKNKTCLSLVRTANVFSSHFCGTNAELYKPDLHDRENRFTKVQYSRPNASAWNRFPELQDHFVH